ncbi:Protein of unknown function [Amphibacillus marinus]|uniref:DUF2752 domain-containing protein n=1 Tax=Amphibacillus marinus TaxID=872970 RepID=A0A1H8N9R2_9BACI|nr:DUF2752 domain-containing protein [Amphibacillus marinus]SEO26441.1 Protein of unknown function [Amphibacillus marinus]
MVPFKKRLTRKALLPLSLVGGGILYLKVLSPYFGIHIPCPFYSVTGLYCPGCGITRASLAILNGDLHQAFRYNMVIFLVLPLLLINYLLEQKGHRQASKLLLTSLLVITILFGILRNIPLFSYLAPTNLSG